MLHDIFEWHIAMLSLDDDRIVEFTSAIRLIIGEEDGIVFTGYDARTTGWSIVPCTIEIFSDTWMTAFDDLYDLDILYTEYLFDRL